MAGLAGCVTEQRAPTGGPVALLPDPPPASVGGPNPHLNALIAEHASANGVPLELAHAVIQIESRYNPKATGRGNTVGLMQIKPATARGIGYSGPAQDLYDPETNLQWGMKYLGRAYELGGGDICGAILRYQGGHRATRMTSASQKYCARAKAIMAGRD